MLVLSGQPTVGSYGYDWVGNRLSPPASPNAMEYNAADQLTRHPGMHRYTYYNDGSLHAVTTDDGTTPVAYYAYTDAGLLATAGPDVNTTWLTNTWDADNNRVSFTENSNTHTLVYDITAGIPAVIQEDGVYYYREPNGALIARQDDETWRLYHFDEIGSTTCLTTLGGTVTDRYTYDPWGNLLTHDTVSDGGTDQPYQYVGQLGYYTHWQEPEFGLLQLGVRFYDPGLGRFTQRDALGGISAYSYAFDEPLRYHDPLGLWPKKGSCVDAWSKALGLLEDWLAGTGGAYRVYGPSSTQTGQIRQSGGVAIARSKAARSCRDGSDVWRTKDAAIETFVLGGILNATTTQVGAYNVDWQFDCRRGVVRYHVRNKLTITSFFYHLPFLCNKPPRTGPMANIEQKFWWEEPAPSGCCCSPGTGGTNGE